MPNDRTPLQVASEGNPPAASRRGLVLSGAIIVGLIALVFGVRYWSYAHVHETTDDAFVDGHIIPISSKVAGQVTKVYVNDNQSVQQGDVLFEIDPRDYEVKVAESHGKLVAAEAEARRAAADAVRYEKIFTQDEISKQQLDTARANAATSEAEVAQQRAVYDQAQLNLSYTKVTAPEAGRITRKNVEAGSFVQVGQNLLTIVPLHVWVTANFKETQLTHMQPGQSVDIHIDAFPKETFTGHVDSIQSGTGERFSVMPPENATGNYVKVVQRIPVKIVIDTQDPNHRLSVGMSAVPSVDIRDTGKTRP